MEKCKHGITKDWCRMCMAEAEREQHTIIRTSLENEKVVQPSFGDRRTDAMLIKNSSYCLIKSKRNHESFQRLGDNTQTVHIDGFPFAWAIEEILARSPNLRELRIIPSMARLISPRAQAMLHKSNVQIKTGHHSPQSAWDADRIEMMQEVSRKDLQGFIKALPEEKVKILEELREYGFEEVEMFDHFMGFENNTMKSLMEISQYYEFSNRSTHAISSKIRGVAVVLGFMGSAGQAARRTARSIQKRLITARRFSRSDQEREDFCRNLGLSELPNNLRAAHLDTFRQVIEAVRNGRLATLKKKYPAWAGVIEYRFGIEKLSDGILTSFRTHTEIASLGIFEFNSRARSHQLSLKAFEALGIEQE